MHLICEVGSDETKTDKMAGRLPMLKIGSLSLVSSFTSRKRFKWVDRGCPWPTFQGYRGQIVYFSYLVNILLIYFITTTSDYFRSICWYVIRPLPHDRQWLIGSLQNWYTRLGTIKYCNNNWASVTWTADGFQIIISKPLHQTLALPWHLVWDTF